MEKVKIDLVPSGVMSTAHASQFDVGRTIRFMLTDEGVSYILAGTEVITMTLRKPDGTDDTFSLTNTSSNYVDWTTSDGDLNLSGVYLAEITITSGSDVIGSMNFLLKVEPDAFDGKNIRTITVGPADICTFETTLPEPLQSVLVDVVATQSGSGTPYPSGGSAQKWDEEWELGTFNTTTGVDVASTTRIRSKNKIPVVGGQNYYFLIPAGKGRAWCIFFDASENVIATPSVPQAYDAQNNSVFLSNEFTVPSGAAYMRFYLATYGATYNYDISLNYPSTDTAYHPYANVRPINGYSSANITRCGVNLFDKTSGQVVNGYFGGSGNIASNSTTRTVYVKCKPNTTYTVSKTAGQRFSVAWFETVPDVGVQTNGNVVDNTASSITITTGVTAKYLGAYVYNQSFDTGTADDMIASVQIAEGTDTTYHAYTGNTYAIAFGQTVYGGVLDVTRGKLHVTWGKTSYDGSSDETWSGSGHIFYTPLYALEKLTDYTDKIVCDKLKTASKNNVLTNDYLISGYYDSGSSYPNQNWLYVRITDSINTVSDLKTWLSSNPIDVIYFLATPFDIDLTPVQMRALVGENNVFADCGQTTVEYLDEG